MTITQTYFLAHTARGKLSSEAARGDHDLRLLVGHANLLDALTLDLQDAEREQNAWFEKTVAETRKASEPKRVQWSDHVAAQLERDEDIEIPDASDDEADSDAGSDDDEEDIYEQRAIPMAVAARRRAASATLMDIVEEDEDMYDDEESENGELQLVRTKSHSVQPPELVHDHSDSDDDEDEEVSPISPPSASFPLPQEIKTKDFAAMDQSGLYRLPPATQQVLSY